MKQENLENNINTYQGLGRVITTAVLATATASAIMAGIMVAEKTARREDAREEAYQQTMQELYEPVGNGGALGGWSTMKNIKWHSPEAEALDALAPQEHIPFDLLADINKNDPRKEDMYQLMNKRYHELLGEYANSERYTKRKR